MREGPPEGPPEGRPSGDREDETKTQAKMDDDKNEIDNETLYLKLKKEPSVLKFDQPLYKKEFLKKNPLIHEEFLDEVESSMQEADSIPFLQEVLPRGAPFFVGWDDKQRKFLVTNRLLTRDKTLSNISVLKNDFREFSTVKNFENLKKWKKKWIQREKPRQKKNKQTFTFTTWPVTEEAIQKNPLLSRLYRVRSDIDMSLAQTPTAYGKGEDLFHYAEPIMDIDIEEQGLDHYEEEQDKIKEVYKTLPSIVQRIEYKNPEKLQLSLAPTRGGFIWPGNDQSKYKLQLKIPFTFRFEEMFKFKTWGFKFK